MKNILLVGTYPVSSPRHGGQIRVDAIKTTYVAAGLNVAHLAVYQNDHYPNEPESPWNITFSSLFVEQLNKDRGRVDVNAADFLLCDEDVMSNTVELLLEFSPDIIQLEQCWMWPFIKKVRAEHPRLRDAKLVYSSQNVEHTLLEHAVMEGGVAITSDVVALVCRMEMDLVQSADVVLACSKEDRTAFQGKSRKTVLAPNGIWPPAAMTGLEYWENEFRARQFALFVGSAHPPNAAGFLEMLAPNMGFLAPNERVVVVGGVCQLLQNSHGFSANIGLNLARTQFVGVQDQGGLSTFLHLANVVLVPILAGGGTNIKMAEALYNRKVVVCTSKATRGYEDFVDSPDVIIADDPRDYRLAITSVLRKQIVIPPTSRRRAEALKGLLWSSTLSSMKEAVLGFV